MADYTTKERDRLDRIVQDYYGDTEDRIVEIVIEANPGLERYGILLPRGIKITLPARLAATPQVPVIKQISLWD